MVPQKLRIIKKMSKNKRSKAEVGASFTVLDASYTKDIEKQDLGNAQKKDRLYQFPGQKKQSLERS